MLRKLLLIIDAQNDFITGSLAVKDAPSFVDQMVLYIQNHAKEYQMCVLTKDWHPETHCSFAENGGEWPAHCVADTEGANVHEKIKFALQDAKICTLALTKGTNEDVEEYSIFNNPKSAFELDRIIADVDEVHICGIAYDYCVLETIKDAIKRGYKDKIVVLPELCPCIKDPERVTEYLLDEEVKLLNK